ncbi:MAG: hypothetical protein HC820_07135, partial [Hydrococcus sp. RM1_1_31]|nr:hypothetical protein [Hydrococcus sp. RM1_1_31]
MDRLLSIALVIIIGLLGAITISFCQIGVTTPRDDSTERIACEVSDESTEDRVTEVDGVRFEIVVPQRIINIPSKEPNDSTNIKFGLKITNNSLKPYIFSRFRSRSLNTIAPNGEKLEWIRGRTNVLSPE